MDNIQIPPILDALTDIEHAIAPLDDVRNLLILLEDTMRDAAASLHPERAWTITVFQNRFEVIMSLLTTSQAVLYGAIQNVTPAISKAYSIHRELNKQQA